MLKVNKKEKKPLKRFLFSIIFILAILSILVGAYTLVLVSSPAIIYTPKPIDIKKIERPKPGQRQLIIPKIGVNIAYDDKGEVSLDRGAEWRYSNRGTPDGKGNFIIAAHRFTIAPTPWQTAEKSPFYHLNKMEIGDPIIVDYEGKRYAYEVTEVKEVEPTAVEIENPSEVPKMTLYTCGLGGAESKRLVLIAKPLGEVDLDKQ